MRCLRNLILNTDSYKASHWLQYPPETDATFYYVESRGGLCDRTLVYGLQAILKEYLSGPVTHADVDEARAVFAAHGEPFNEGRENEVDAYRNMLRQFAKPGAVFAVVSDSYDSFMRSASTGEDR